MLTLTANILGGIGLFLLGMTLMSDGLRSVGGDALHSLLQRFTTNRISSFITGAVITAMTQSSSVSTLMTIGFVSAGLMTFTQSLGVIIGTNLGTTMTSWLVATIGLKIQISAFALPIVGVGAFAFLLGKNRIKYIGSALAGFGLIFVGIDILQVGMVDLSTQYSPADFVIPGLMGRLLLVVVGIVMTILMQSSSAAVAATLTALSAGTIELDHAAALIVGQNVGTTFTAALATIGATKAARRTALAHILFNIITGIVALLLLSWLIGALQYLLGLLGANDDPTVLAAFHTAFNLLGALLFLPFLEPFARLIIRIVPGPERTFASQLDRTAQMVPAIAIDAVRTALTEMLTSLTQKVELTLREPEKRPELDALLTDLHLASARTRTFLTGVQSSSTDGAGFQQHLDVLHALDHFDRALHRIEETQFFSQARANQHFDPIRRRLLELLRLSDYWLSGESENPAEDLQAIADLAGEISDARQKLREDLIVKATYTSLDPVTEQRILNWLSRIAYHVWRSIHHISGASASADQPPEPME